MKLIKELIKEKKAVLLIYIAICIAISGYLYADEESFYGMEKYYLWREAMAIFNKSLFIEGAGLFLLLGWFAYKGDKEDK